MKVFQGWKIRALSSLLVMWSPCVSCLQMYHQKENRASFERVERGRKGVGMGWKMLRFHVFSRMFVVLAQG